jgi:hypothetical protein
MLCVQPFFPPKNINEDQGPVTYSQTIDEDKILGPIRGIAKPYNLHVNNLHTKKYTPMTEKQPKHHGINNSFPSHLVHFPETKNAN